MAGENRQVEQVIWRTGEAGDIGGQVKQVKLAQTHVWEVAFDAGGSQPEMAKNPPLVPAGLQQA